MLMESAALPIPSEIILPFAGYLVYMGKLEFFSVLFVSTFAALIGSFVDYYLGLKLGRGIFTARLANSICEHATSSKCGSLVSPTWTDRSGPLPLDASSQGYDLISGRSIPNEQA